MDVSCAQQMELAEGHIFRMNASIRACRRKECHSGCKPLLAHLCACFDVPAAQSGNKRYPRGEKVSNKTGCTYRQYMYRVLAPQPRISLSITRIPYNCYKLLNTKLAVAACNHQPRTRQRLLEGCRCNRPYLLGTFTPLVNLLFF